jgi:hypothetical protein
MNPEQVHRSEDGLLPLEVGDRSEVLLLEAGHTLRIRLLY